MLSPPSPARLFQVSQTRRKKKRMKTLKKNNKKVHKKIVISQNVPELAKTTSCALDPINNSPKPCAAEKNI
jgi:hypothetical protein